MVWRSEEDQRVRFVMPLAIVVVSVRWVHVVSRNPCGHNHLYVGWACHDICDIDAVGTFGPNASFVSLDVLEHRICHP